MYVCIGKTPSHNVSAKRAHHSLPQPLHLKAVFTDCNERKSSIRFEFVSNTRCRVHKKACILSGYYVIGQSFAYYWS